MNSVITKIDKRGVATLVLNRPLHHNAFDDVMIEVLNSEIQKLNEDPHVKILVLSSQGESFSAGADLSWMQKMAHYTLAENVQDAHKLGQLMYNLYHFTKPTIAMVQGPTFGGGVGLVACCHIAIASSKAMFCFSEVKLGLIPAIISPYIINAMGLRNTKAYFLSGLSFDANSAKQMGLCHEVVESQMLAQRCEQLIHTLLRNGPEALKAVNALLNQLQPLAITQQIVDFTVNQIANIRVSPEGQEGLKAFLEKRKPTWINVI